MTAKRRLSRWWRRAETGTEPQTPPGNGTSIPQHADQQDDPTPAESGDRSDLLGRVATVLGNVAVLTALLVYFGWVRSEVQARTLGIDESILGMSTQEYLLRSVRPVLILLIVVATAGLLWVLFDHWLTNRLRRRGSDDRLYTWIARLMPAAIIVLPVAGWFAQYPWPALAYIAFPLMCAAGLLLALYALRLRAALPGGLPLGARHGNVLRACVAALVGVALFVTASNYATVEGTELARSFDRQLPALPRVVVHSVNPLNIDAPGVEATQLDGTVGFAYRYSGLRLLERAGGRYFFVSDGWTPEYGVVVVLKDDEPGIRYDFVRDQR
jgi:hypothetical protein